MSLRALENAPQWVVVKLVPLPNGKTDKIPCSALTGQHGIDAHSPANWCDHTRAVSTAAAWGPGYTVGFVLTAADDFWCLDIDDALRPDGSWSPLATALCARLAGGVVELSQSGRGLHIWGLGSSALGAHTMKRVDLGIEFYTEARFIAIGTGATGTMAASVPSLAGVVAEYFPPRAVGAAVAAEGPCAEWWGPTDDAELLRRALQSKSTAGVFGGRATFADLWHADTDALARAYPGDPFDASSADAALAQHLAFWTGRDVARIERLMRQSSLAREKWDMRDDYLVERTIMAACGMCINVLQDKKLERAEVPTNTPPAVQAMSARDGAQFLGAVEQAELFKGCVYVLDVHKALIMGGRLINPDRFRVMFGGYTFMMDGRNERTSRNAWEAFTESQLLKAPHADSTCFRPGLPPAAIVSDTGTTRVNTHWPVDVPCTPGDPSLFLQHLAKLLPNADDRGILLAYMAACVQHQGVKFQWAPVIQGVEGNGKTFLSRCVAEAIGRRYVHWPKASKLAKQFNSWMVGKTFYAVEDIHTSEQTDVIEELKPMITGGDGLEIEAKGVDQVSAEICGNFMFNTNHAAGLRKTRNDRRFAVFYCAQQQASDLVRDGMGGNYMRQLYDWVRDGGGYAVVTHYLKNYPIPDHLNPAGGCQRAPITSSTEAAIEAGLGRVEQEIAEQIDQGTPGFCGGWISSMAVDKLLDRMHRGGAVPPNRRRDMLRSMGYDWHPGLTSGRVHNVVLPDGGKPRLFVSAGHPSIALTSAAAIAAAYCAAQGVQLPR